MIYGFFLKKEMKGKGIMKKEKEGEIVRKCEKVRERDREWKRDREKESQPHQIDLEFCVVYGDSKSTMLELWEHASNKENER